MQVRPTPLDLLAALDFAADKHRHQRRKDRESSPYVNHPIQVAEVLARIGKVSARDVLVAAILHDTLEDTATTKRELVARFGARVACLVAEVTDDKSLPKAVRKRLQVEHAPALSRAAKLIKLGDKICNVRDVAESPPAGWSRARRIAYLRWSREVVAGCRGTGTALEREFDRVLRHAARLCLR
ncbi:MAG TPA: HD domain-containing protein [Myxococcota bacterium]|nr:HD domain-containing protein [Myxococcota bacterium]